MNPSNINKKIFLHEPNLLDGNRPFERGQQLPVDEKRKNISRFGTDVDENTGDDASDLEPEPTIPKASTTKKVAVPKTSKKRGPRGPYKTKPKQQFLNSTKLLYYYIKTEYY